MSTGRHLPGGLTYVSSLWCLNTKDPYMITESRPSMVSFQRRLIYRGINLSDDNFKYLLIVTKMCNYIWVFMVYDKKC